MKKLLLISNSVAYGKGYLDHCQEAIKEFLGETDSLLFIPYASKDQDRYADVVMKRFARMGIRVESIHTQDPVTALNRAKAIFVGGGNTFRLLKTIKDLGILDLTRSVVLNGTLYMGASAGVNLACPTIKTTNDMPIVFPGDFKALNLINFQINPHYIDKDPLSKHQGETREERINEFHQENDTPVLGLYEGSWLNIENDSIILGGINGAKLFKQDEKSQLLANGSIINII